MYDKISKIVHAVDTQKKNVEDATNEIMALVLSKDQPEFLTGGVKAGILNVLIASAKNQTKNIDVYKDCAQLKGLLAGKIVVDIEGDDNPENDCTIVFSDGTKLLIEAHGDDMSYTKLEVTLND